MIAKEIKCVVWDLDNTLWDGVLLEDDNVKLKPKVVEIIKELDSRGIIHSIASKNNYDSVMKKLEEFGIKEYFLYPEIHWNLKSQSIKNIIKNLNIGADSILFVDDQQFELDEVKNEIEMLTCFNAVNYLTLVENERLKPRFITEDSKRRRVMYFEDIKRKKEEENFSGHPEKFLATINMKIYITEAEEKDLKRAEELTLRTHQLNSTGVCYSYEELNELRKSKDYKIFICELEDTYGSYGKIGLALVDCRKEWHLKLLLMSCRVMSRGIGTVMLNYIMSKAKSYGDKMYADFKVTDRNRQMYITYKFANFKEVSSGDDGQILFVNNLVNIQNCPEYVELYETIKNNKA